MHKPGHYISYRHNSQKDKDNSALPNIFAFLGIQSFTQDRPEMLDLQEYRYNLCFLQILSSLCIIPFEVNTTAGTLALTQVRWKKRTSTMMWFLLCAHTFYMWARLFQSFSDQSWLHLHTFTLHFGMAISAMYAAECYFVLVIRSPQVTVAIFNSFFATSAPGETRTILISHGLHFI